MVWRHFQRQASRSAAPNQRANAKDGARLSRRGLSALIVRAAMQIDQPFDDRQTEPCSLFRRFDRERSAAKRFEDEWQLFFRNAGARIGDFDFLPALAIASDGDLHFTILRREFDRVAQQIKADLPHRFFIGPERLERRIDFCRHKDRFGLGTHLQHVATFFGWRRDGSLPRVIHSGLLRPATDQEFH